jgi:hypothetical protein
MLYRKIKTFADVLMMLDSPARRVRMSMACSFAAVESKNPSAIRLLPGHKKTAMWLGHEDIATTHQYIEADLEIKEAALKRMDAPSSKPVRFKAKDRLLDFLEGL